MKPQKELAHRIKRWSEAVAEIASGVEINDDEYLDLVDRRQLLHEVLADGVVPDDVVEDDCKFRSLTSSSSTCVWGDQNQAENNWSPDVHWWYFRVVTGR